MSLDQKPHQLRRGFSYALLPAMISEGNKGLHMSRGYQKLLAFVIGFPFFVFSLGQFFIRWEPSDDTGIWGPAVLLGLAIWLWGLYAPMRDEQKRHSSNEPTTGITDAS